MTMTIKNLRASQGTLQAEVVIGQKDNGGVVTTLVKVDRRSEEVQAAFVLLDNVLLREAQSAVDQAVTNEARRRKEHEARTGRKAVV